MLHSREILEKFPSKTGTRQAYPHKIPEALGHIIRHEKIICIRIEKEKVNVLVLRTLFPYLKESIVYWYVVKSERIHHDE